VFDAIALYNGCMTEFLNEKIKIEDWLKRHAIHNYQINADMTIDVKGDVDISDNDLRELAVQFRGVDGSFDCSMNALTSLAGSPQSVGGDFNCHNNDLQSLKGGPITVGKDFNCAVNALTSLRFAPLELTQSLRCEKNKLTSLEFLPNFVPATDPNKNMGNSTKALNVLWCVAHNELSSLEFMPPKLNCNFDCSHNSLDTLQGSSLYVGGAFQCGYNRLVSLEFCPKRVEGPFVCNNNQISHLEFLPEHANRFYSHANPLPEDLTLLMSFQNAQLFHKKYLLIKQEKEKLEHEIKCVSSVSANRRSQKI